MITIVHGGQTGVDRGAHEAAIDNGWLVAGYMPRDGRDELGRIPPDVARFLTPHEKTNYAARTEANVRASAAALIVVRDADDPRTTPGTAKTIDLAASRQLRPMIVDPKTDAAQIARWIWNDVLVIGTPLQLEMPGLVAGTVILPDPVPTKLLVAGPRESKWPGARDLTAALLRRVALALGEIARSPNQAKISRRAGAQR
jgi:hypothetical protein